MTDLTDDLRALVAQWRKEAARDFELESAFVLLDCSDDVDAILARQSTPPMTREALEEAERKGGVAEDSDEYLYRLDHPDDRE